MESLVLQVKYTYMPSTLSLSISYRNKIWGNSATFEVTKTILALVLKVSLHFIFPPGFIPEIPCVNFHAFWRQRFVDVLWLHRETFSPILKGVMQPFFHFCWGGGDAQVVTQQPSLGICTPKLIQYIQKSHFSGIILGSKFENYPVRQFYDLVFCSQGNKRYTFVFFKRPQRYTQEVLSHSSICLPLPYMEGIVLICNIDLYCVTGIFNGTGDMFKRQYFHTLNTNWSNKISPRSLTHWCSHLTCIPDSTHNCKQRAVSNRELTVNKEQWATWG